jgi:hypothetical protein
MKQIINRFLKYKPLKILIDGALFRKSIASTSLVDSVILVTGASYHSDMEKVVQDTKSLLDQLTLDQTKNNFVYQYGLENNYFLNDDKQLLIEESIIGNVTSLLQGINHYHTLCLKGALTNQMVDLFIENRDTLTIKEIIILDGSRILLTEEQYQKLKKLQIKITSYQKMNILFVAYNPTSPYHYQFDNQEFKKQLQTHLKEEVINVCMDLENVLWEN